LNKIESPYPKDVRNTSNSKGAFDKLFLCFSVGLWAFLIRVSIFIGTVNLIMCEKLIN